jgi:hypothetical protein
VNWLAPQPPKPERRANPELIHLLETHPLMTCPVVRGPDDEESPASLVELVEQIVEDEHKGIFRKLDWPEDSPPPALPAVPRPRALSGPRRELKWAEDTLVAKPQLVLVSGAVLVTWNFVTFDFLAGWFYVLATLVVYMVVLHTGKERARKERERLRPPALPSRSSAAAKARDWDQLLANVSQDVRMDRRDSYTFQCQVCGYACYSAQTLGEGCAAGTRHYMEHKTRKAQPPLPPPAPPRKRSSEVEDYREAQEREYGTYVARVPIYVNGALAYRAGDSVPVVNVEQYAYLRDGLVEPTGMIRFSLTGTTQTAFEISPHPAPHPAYPRGEWFLRCQLYQANGQRCQVGGRYPLATDAFVAGMEHVESHGKKADGGAGWDFGVL